MKIKGLIFDFDGTLLETFPVCYVGFRTALKKFTGRDYSEEEIKMLFGPTEEGIFQRLLPEQWKECLALYLETYDQAHRDYAEPFPGIEQALDLLSARNVKLAIVSGKGPASMRLSLKHSRLERYFPLIVTGSEEGPDKPRRIKKVLEAWGCQPDEVAYIGDIPHDIEDSREAGTIPLGAVWAGSASKNEVLAMKPAETFTTVNDFIKWIEEHVELN